MTEYSSATINGISYSRGDSVSISSSATCYTSADGKNGSNTYGNLSNKPTIFYVYNDSYVGRDGYDPAPYHVSHSSSSASGYWFKASAFPKAQITINYYSNGADYCTFEGTEKALGSQTKVASDTFYYNTTESSGLANVQNTSYLYLSRTGYSATGYWGTSASGGTLIHQDTSQTANTLSSTLGVNISSGSGSANVYAQWTPNTYTVTFDSNGGETLTQLKDVEYDSAYGDLPASTRTGYTFDGWYTAASKGDKITSSTQVKTASNHTLYAHWTANEYTITYNPNEGDLNDMPESQIYSYSENDTVTLHSSKPIRIGYTFVEWNTKQDGSGDGYQPSASFTKVADDTTLYAIWRENVLVVNYKSNYATYALVDGVENKKVSADQKDIVVKTITYKYATPLVLRKYSNEDDDTYMKRTRYDATGYWGRKSGSEEEIEEGFVTIHENATFNSGAKFAEALGAEVLNALETGDFEIDLYAQWVLLASRITVFDKDGNEQKGLVHIYTDNMNFITSDGDMFKDFNNDYFITGVEFRYGIITIFDSNGIARVAI